MAERQIQAQHCPEITDSQNVVRPVKQASGFRQHRGESSGKSGGITRTGRKLFFQQSAEGGQRIFQKISRPQKHGFIRCFRSKGQVRYAQL